MYFSQSLMVSTYQSLVSKPEIFASESKLLSSFVLLPKMEPLGNTQKHPKVPNTIKQLTSPLLV